MLIYEALKNDHKEVKALLRDLIAMDEQTPSDARNNLVEEIRDALIPHSRAEEQVFYNSLRELNSAKGMAFHGYAEHVAAETLLRTLQVAAKIDAGWKATANELKAALEHHIEEEESEMFTAGRALFTTPEAEAMAEVFEKLKPEIRKQGIVGTTMDMFANLMPPRLVDAFRASASVNNLK